MYSIGHVAEQVGISPATLRAWERRYAIVHPRRTQGDYRVYSHEDLRVLQSMKHLIDEGWAPSFAAREAVRRHDETVEVAAPPAPSPAMDVTTIPEQFVAAAASLDSGRLDTILDQLFASGSYEHAISSHLLPALTALGDAWAAGQVSVAGEHLASNAVSRRLATAYEAAASPTTAAGIVMGLPPGSRHELGLLAFAVAARRQGLPTQYLGADVPLADWVTAGSMGAAAVVLAIPTDADASAAIEVVAALQRQTPGLVIATGGAAQDQAPAGVAKLGHDIAGAARALAHLLATPSVAPAPS